MNKKIFIKKGLVVAVILLFIGIAFAPSINANVSKASIDSELVEFTTELCGLNGAMPNTVSLSKEDAEEVEKLIDDVKRRLDNVETREETVDIFNEAVVELDKYGLLGGLSVKQAQRLVTGGYQNRRAMKVLEKLYSRNQENSDNTNLLCLITGEFDVASVCFQHLIASIIPLLITLTGIFFLSWNFLRFWINMFLCYAHIGVAIGFGHNIGVDNGWEKWPAEGWIQTNGLSGVKNWNGSVYGHLTSKIVMFLPMIYYYVGCIGFTGIKVTIFGVEPYYYFIGSALAVKLGSEEPEF
jgi:hypothetical protein